MISHVIKLACVAAALTALSACSMVEKERPTETLAACDNSLAPGVEVAGLPSWIQMLKLIVNGKLAQEVLKDPEQLQAELKTLAEAAKISPTAYDDKGLQLRTTIDAIEESELTSGMAGISVRAFLLAAKASLDEQGRFRAAAQPISKGKIVAYYYDEVSKQGCLRVLMFSKALSPDGQLSVEVHRWTVFATLHVAKRRHKDEPGYDENNVFPDSDSIPITEDLASDRGAEYKLWAKGADIEVRSVERSTDGVNFVTLPSSDKLYETTDASCIDMMFQVPPPRTLPPGRPPPFYCLGRCDHPPIINTK